MTTDATLPAEGRKPDRAPGLLPRPAPRAEATVSARPETNPSAREAEARKLARIRDQFDAIAPGRWMRAQDGEGALLVADGPRGEKFEILRFTGYASEAETAFVCDAAEAVRFLLDLVDRAARKVRELAPPPPAEPAAPNYAAEAAIKCGEPAFKAFLIERHGLDKLATDERTAQRLRTLLKITSRAELNADADAAARWKALRGDFEGWKRAER
jgi:hypothetical protein